MSGGKHPTSNIQDPEKIQIPNPKSQKNFKIQIPKNVLKERFGNIPSHRIDRSERIPKTRHDGSWILDLLWILHLGSWRFLFSVCSFALVPCALGTEVIATNAQAPVASEIHWSL